jgi:hypothetical protein
MTYRCLIDEDGVNLTFESMHRELFPKASLPLPLYTSLPKELNEGLNFDIFNSQPLNKFTLKQEAQYKKNLNTISNKDVDYITKELNTNWERKPINQKYTKEFWIKNDKEYWLKNWIIHPQYDWNGRPCNILTLRCFK